MPIAKDTVVGQYKVVSRLGSGAMGEVFLATDEGLGRKVALKILLDSHRNNPELRARFAREARAVAAIQHPNVVQVFATGEYDGLPYLAMEYLGGQDLGQLVRQNGPMDSRRAAAAIRDSARGLAAAARAGLIHRDVKPSNLMLLPDGSIKVTDFGLAKPLDPGEHPALTALGVVVGTPDYIAPEQARGDEIDSRVDLYALGCTLFFLLTGRPPYRKSLDDSEKYLKVVARHLRDPVPDPREEKPDTDDELAELQMQMMAKDADARPSYDHVIARLDRIDIRLASGVSAPKRDQRVVNTKPLGAQASRTQAVEPLPPPDRSVRRAAPSDATHDSMAPVDSLTDAAAGMRLPRPLLAFTVVCVLFFTVALGLRLFGPLPERAAVAGPPSDAGPPPPPPPADAAVLVDETPTPPPGMLLVPGNGRHPAFYVDRAPVTNRQWAEFTPKHKFTKKTADVPVTGVSYAYAVAYAHAQHKRLLRADEWDAALATPQFVPPGMKLLEWVDDGSTDGPTRSVRGVNGAVGKRPAGGDAAVTFRLAVDP